MIQEMEVIFWEDNLPLSLLRNCFFRDREVNKVAAMPVKAVG